MPISKIRLTGPLPIIIAPILILVFFGEFFLERTLSSKAIRTLLKDKVYEALAIDFTYQDIELDFLPLSLQFAEVQASRGDQQFAAEHIAAGVSAWSLFMGEIKLGTVQITKPSYRFKKQSTNSDNKTSRQWPTINNRYLERLVIVDPDLELDIAGNKNNQRLTINGGKIVANFVGNDKFSVSIEIDQLNYSHGDKNRLTNAEIKASLELLRDNFTLTIDHLKEQHIESLTGSWRGQAIVDNQQQITSPLTVRGQGEFRGDLAVLNAQLGIKKTFGVAQANFKIDMVFAANKPVYYSATGLAQVKDGQLGGIKLYDSSTQLTVTPKTLRFADGKLGIVGQQRGKFSGWIAFTRGIDFDFTADIERLTLAEILAAFGINKFDVFNFDLNSPKVKVYGRGKPLSLKVVGASTISGLTINKLTNYSTPPPCQVDINLRSTNEQLSFNKIKAKCQTADKEIFTPLAIDGSISYKSRNVEITASSNAFDLSTLKFLVKDNISGQAKLTTTIGGLTNAIKIDNSLTINRISLANKQLGRGQAKLTARADQLTVDNLQFRPTGGGVINLQQATLFYKNLQFAANLKASNVSYRDLNWLTSRYRLPVAFAVNNLQAKISKGFLLQPLAYQGEVLANLAEIKSNKQKLADNLRLKAVSDRRGWRVAVQSLRIAGTNLRGKLSHQRKVAFQYDKFADSKDLLTRLGVSRRDKLFVTLIGGSNNQQPLPYLPADYLRAIFDEVKLTVNGSLKALRAKMVTKMHNTRLFGMRIATAQVTANLDNKQLTLTVNTPDRTVSGQIAIEVWRAGFPFNWQLQFNRFNVQQLMTLATTDDNYARLSGHWDLRGKLHDWWNSHGEFVSNDFQLRYLNKDLATDQTLILHQQKPFKLLFNKGRWSLADGQRRIAFKSEHSMFHLEIADNNRPSKLAVDFYGVIDGKILPIFFQEVDVASGFLQLQGKLRGEITNPQIDVDVERLSPLSISVAGLRPAFNDIDVKAKYRAGQLLIEELSGQKGDGSIKVQGRVQILDSNPRSASANFLQIDLQNAKFVHPILGFKNTELNMVGQLNLRWQKLPINVSGNLTISRASNFSDFDVRKVILASFGKKKYQTALVDHKPRVAFRNLTIVADRALTIENRNMQALLSTRLQILGTNIAPEINGFVRVDKGKFIYRRNFIVTHGLINFNGGFDPVLDLRAYSEVSSYVVNLVISGPASDPVAELTIDPAIRDNGTLITKIDILTLLNRGTLPPPGTAVSNAGNTGVSEVANVLIGQFERPLEKLLRRSGQNIIKQIYIDTHTSQKGVLYPKLTAPINLPWHNWDLNVQVDPYTWRLLGEYLIHDGISLSGTISGQSQDDQPDVATTTNDQAVDLKFRFSIP